MGRAPCCEKMGLKKGPWTPQDDQILTSFINKYGHENWRSLPKQAGLLRCGKSCRLRWINYLRPDIKRGNFSVEEEDTIIQLHEMLGNRWSAIAARLPGRTDNEIKNVWHTHLKKRVSSYGYKPVISSKSAIYNNFSEEERYEIKTVTSGASSAETDHHSENSTSNDMSNQSSSSDITSFCYKETTNEDNKMILAVEGIKKMEDQTMKSTNNDFSAIFDESFLLEALSGDHDIPIEYFLDSPRVIMSQSEGPLSPQDDMNILQDMDFWYDIFIKAGGSPDIPEF